MLAAFSLWLKNKPYTTHTQRNYLVDIRKFLTWTQSQPSSKFNQKLLISYLSLISQEKSYSRQLASIKLFCQFAKDQNLTASDIFASSLKAITHLGNSEIINQQNLLAEYAHWLKLQKVSKSTLRNYLSDLNDYLNWLHA